MLRPAVLPSAPFRYLQECIRLCSVLTPNPYPFPFTGSLLDYAKGFGGKYGVEADKVDKSAMGFEYQGKTEKHESQKGLFCYRQLNHTVYWAKSSTHCVFQKNLFCIYTIELKPFKMEPKQVVQLESLL